MNKLKRRRQKNKIPNNVKTCHHEPNGNKNPEQINVEKKKNSMKPQKYSHVSILLLFLLLSSSKCGFYLAKCPFAWDALNQVCLCFFILYYTYQVHTYFVFDVPSNVLLDIFVHRYVCIHFTLQIQSQCYFHVSFWLFVTFVVIWWLVIIHTYQIIITCFLHVHLQPLHGVFM